MDDLISRQAAIDTIHSLYAIHGSEGSWIDQKDAFKALENLPPAQPKQKIGRLVDTDDGHSVECSECGEWFYHGYLAKKKIKFCSNCGAKMEVEQNDA